MFARALTFRLLSVGFTFVPIERTERRGFVCSFGGRGIVLAALVVAAVATPFILRRLPCSTRTLRPIVDGRALSCRRKGRLRTCIGALGALIGNARCRGVGLRRVMYGTPTKPLFGGTKRMLGRALCFRRFHPIRDNSIRPRNHLHRTVRSTFNSFRTFGRGVITTSANLFNSK